MAEAEARAMAEAEAEARAMDQAWLRQPAAAPEIVAQLLGSVAVLLAPPSGQAAAEATAAEFFTFLGVVSFCILGSWLQPWNLNLNLMLTFSNCGTFQTPRRSAGITHVSAPQPGCSGEV